MILSAPIAALRPGFGDEQSIRLMAQAGFDAVDYTFNLMCDPACVWNTEEFESYAIRLRRRTAGYFSIKPTRRFSFSGEPRVSWSSISCLRWNGPLPAPRCWAYHISWCIPSTICDTGEMRRIYGK